MDRCRRPDPLWLLRGQLCGRERRGAGGNRGQRSAGKGRGGTGAGGQCGDGQRHPKSSGGALSGPSCGASGGDSHRDPRLDGQPAVRDRKSTRLNSSHVKISYAVFCLKKKKKKGEKATSWSTKER